MVLNTTHGVFDAIIVGSGAAGGWAAKELSEGGMRVLVLEAGRTIDENADFPPGVTPDAMNMWSRIWYALRGQSIQARYGSFGDWVNRFYVNDRENPYTVPSGAPFLWYRGRQVGGRMHTWARSAYRMSDSDFHRPDLAEDDGVVWPIAYKDLAPYYDKVEETLGIVGDCDGVENLPDCRCEPGPPPTAANLILAERIRARTGLTVIRNRLVRHNTDRTFLPLKLASQTGGLVVQPDSIVASILVDSNSGNARGVAYYDRLLKVRKEALARTVVLCASALESVRILLNSACAPHPNGIGASSGVLGHYISDHVMIGKGGLTPVAFSNDVEAAGVDSAPPNSDPYDLGVYSMYIPGFSGGRGDEVHSTGGYGIQCDATTHRWRMLAFGQMTPHYENRIQLDPRKKDAWGIPVARIDVRHRESERDLAARMNASMDWIARQVGFIAREGGGKIARGPQALIFKSLKSMVFQESGAFHPGAAIHETGGARMGADPGASVVNPYCQCWDVPNVFVTDGACFPSLGYQNHTLTIMAVTVRACEYILRQQG